MPRTEALQLPRPLVNLLLHQAQYSPGFSQGFVLRDGHSGYKCVPLAPNADLIAAAAGTQTPLAFYRSSSAPLPALTAEESAALANCTGLYLGVALDTKGVLQLRAWRIGRSQIQELDVAIT